jgi:PIN domain nuclease of toxin-antitoxin system
MDLLLDTHVLIWYLDGDKQLSPKIKDLITDVSNRCYVSIASLWEMAIKISNNKLEINGKFDELTSIMNDNAIDLLPVTFEHLQSLLRLEYHHRDPFDRIIIAQAISENLILASKEEIFKNYPVSVAWD